ncbi:MAG: glycosyltransferase family 2 protein [Eggerthellaceae bacterium]|nr:glycosyltransferase family 2 protein [Eggerthellaceae bacterium]
MVSILVSVYNSEHYVERHIDRIVCQSYKNIKIILINYYSTDWSIEILNSYKEKFPELTKIINMQTEGIAKPVTLE